MKGVYKMIEVLVKEVGKELEERTVEHTIEALQEIVQGYFRNVNLPRNIIMWVNEEGNLRPLPLNLFLKKDREFSPIVGNVFFTGTTMSGDTVSLSDYQKDWLKKNMVSGGHAYEGARETYRLSVLKVR